MPEMRRTDRAEENHQPRRRVEFRLGAFGIFDPACRVDFVPRMEGRVAAESEVLRKRRFVGVIVEVSAGIIYACVAACALASIATQYALLAL